MSPNDVMMAIAGCIFLGVFAFVGYIALNVGSAHQSQQAQAIKINKDRR